ncbi:MAG: 30S ribosomal protein S6 [Candidatus Aminicenantes bacterium]|nr:30S ribosomal protein S6 [Candidatus Aminicenantes bacterium]MDH5466492.1 30S ribosomal protein S6 [Candidatus Aminicenantes bacterium]
MTQYETAFLISPNLEEEAIEKVISQMAEVVKKKGKLINEDRWGKKKLAYPIQKFEEAFYVFFLYEADPAVPFELERQFKQTEAILRYLTIKKETKEKEVPEEEKSLPASEEKPTEGEDVGGDIEEEAVEKKKKDEEADEKEEAVEKEEKVDEEVSLPEEKEKEED